MDIVLNYQVVSSVQSILIFRALKAGLGKVPGRATDIMLAGKVSEASGLSSRMLTISEACACQSHSLAIVTVPRKDLCPLLAATDICTRAEKNCSALRHCCWAYRRWWARVNIDQQRWMSNIELLCGTLS
jgi:hypothetical protein